MSQKINLDPAQLKIFQELNKLKTFLESNSSSFFSKIFKNDNAPLSLYIHGQVGRGKSMIMHKFFDELKINDKLYFHFNSFMQKIHRELHALRQSSKRDDKDIVEIATKNIIGNIRIICLDEFQVEDVTDALILRKVFSYIFSKKILVVFTSNAHPQNLYKNGLQRESFLKFVGEILLKNCAVLNLDNGVDYRRQYLQSVKKHYFSTINSDHQNQINEIIEKMTDGEVLREFEMEVLGRKLKLKRTYKNVAIFDFNELCSDNFGVADYQAICREFSVIFLLNIPHLEKEDVNEARRFILFIDEIYENKVALLMLAACKIDEIYADGIGAEAFKRTVSRLNEIISENYWQQSKYILQ